MSFPSIAAIAAEKRVSLATCSAEMANEILLAAVRQDCPEAVDFLHQKSHEAKECGPITWVEPPNSILGKQLIRIHASDAVRPLVEKHVCHGMRLTFFNCCGGVVGPTKVSAEELAHRQIAFQAGPVAYADC